MCGDFYTLDIFYFCCGSPWGKVFLGELPWVMWVMKNEKALDAGVIYYRSSIDGMIAVQAILL